MRAAGILMMVIGLVLVIAPLGVAASVGATFVQGQSPAMLALYGLLVVMGAALIVVGKQTAFPKP